MITLLVMASTLSSFSLPHFSSSFISKSLSHKFHNSSRWEAHFCSGWSFYRFFAEQATIFRPTQTQKKLNSLGWKYYYISQVYFEDIIIIIIFSLSLSIAEQRKRSFSSTQLGKNFYSKRRNFHFFFSLAASRFFCWDYKFFERKLWNYDFFSLRFLSFLSPLRFCPFVMANFVCFF